MNKLTTIKPLVEMPRAYAVVPFTRLWMVNEFLEMFGKIDFGDSSEVALLFYNDTDDVFIQTILTFWLEHNSDKFAGAQVWFTNEPKLDENGDYNHILKRRNRIIEMRQKCAELMLPSEYAFFLEDDTLVKPDAYQKLLGAIVGDPKVAIVSGVEMNRHAYPILGLWHIQPVHDPQTIQTARYQAKGITEVDGAGMYCYVTRTALYKKANFRFEAECLGPDNCYGWDLRKEGWKVLVDWSVKCAHRVQNKGSIMPSAKAKQATWKKQDDVWALWPTAE